MSGTKATHRRPQWSDQRSDDVVVQCLLESGIGFAKAWKELMEPCLLLRTKTAASAYWYKTKKNIELYWGGRSWVTEYEPEPSPREYLRKARMLLLQRREDALKYPCEKQPPTLCKVKREIVFYEWFARVRPPSTGHIFDEDNGDYCKQLKAEFKAMPMADKVKEYLRLRPGPQ